MTTDTGLPPMVHLRHNFPMTEPVARARARLLPFHRRRDPDQLPAPGSLIHLDFEGSLTPSYPHGYICYCGAVDAGSGLMRLLPCHSPSKETSQRCLELLLADLRMYMGLTHKLIPHVVATDQGTQFMSHFFRDFLSAEQVRHWPATIYTPQQNALVERMWGTRFGMARVFLKAANLGPALHPFAIQTANWVLNRLPQPSRGNMSPIFILSKRPASLAYLRLFGSLARVTLPWPKRSGDRHFADRGAMGVYLGPSELSPGSVIYLPKTRQFLVSRDIIVYEDLQPDTPMGCRLQPRVLHRRENLDAAPCPRDRRSP